MNYAIFRSEPIYTLNDLDKLDHIIKERKKHINLILI